MNDNITPRLDKVLKNAKKEAIKLGTGYVGLEHVVIAIIDANVGFAVEAMKKTTVLPEVIKAALQKSVTPTEDGKDKNALVTFNKELETALVAAKAISDKFNHQYVGTEHVLIAVWESGATATVNVFKALELDPDVLKKILIELLESGSRKNPPPDKIPAGGRGTEEDKSTSSTEAFIKKFAIDLTERAAKGGLDPVIGRSDEVKRVIHILSRKKKNNPVLVGPPGVGKTSIVEGLALRIHEGSVPKQLLNKRLFALDLGLLVAGTMYRGQFEERVKKILKEVKDNPNYIVFIDELHTVIGAGAAEGAMDVSNMFKPALARGEFTCIGATTEDEHRRYIEKDSALERRFQLVKVDEPNHKDTVAILNGAAKTYASFHGVSYAEDVVEAIVSFSNRFITDRFQPDKGFDVMDETGALVKLAFTGSPETKRELELKLVEAHTARGEAAERLEFETAGKHEKKIKRLELQLAKLKASEEKTDLVVRVSHVQQVISSWTGIPISDLSTTDKTKLLGISEELGSVVIAQPDAIKCVSQSVKKYRTPLKDPRRPIGNFLFVGPTGVGKTLLAKTLAQKVFGSDKSILELDMAEYADGTALNKLIGSSAGYVGYGDGAKLLKHVKSKPYSVVLLDEIEKAHPDVIQALLGVMEEGRLTDSQGKTIDFRNTIIIMTSNVGVEAAKSMGFGTASDSSERAKGNMLVDIRKTFKPEFLNRVEVVFFNPLTSSNARSVVGLEVDILNKRLADSKVVIQTTEAAIDFIVNNGYNEKYGARNIRRQIEEKIENSLTDEFLADRIPENSVITFDVVDSKLQHSISGS